MFLSVTTPGLVPMDGDGHALAPAVLFFDSRSRAQASRIREIVGDAKFLDETCNLPVSGGSSLSSILWFLEEAPEVARQTHTFGHTNTFMVRRLTGRWAVDQTTMSITGLYNTRADDLTWNHDILGLAGISADRLPPLFRAHSEIGRILPAVARELGIPEGAVVLCGGNDAVLSALGSGITEPGELSLTSGTADIASLCTAIPVASPTSNVRCHAVPGRWLSFIVLNSGARAFDWYRSVCCSEMSDEEYFGSFVPRTLADFLGDPDVENLERALPWFDPYLAGSRYHDEPSTASFTGVTLQTTRQQLLLSIVRGNAQYLQHHLRQLPAAIQPSGTVVTSGTIAGIPGMSDARRRWLGDYEYTYQSQSSLLGAAVLGRAHLLGVDPGAAVSRASAPV